MSGSIIVYTDCSASGMKQIRRVLILGFRKYLLNFFELNSTAVPFWTGEASAKKRQHNALDSKFGFQT